MAKYKISLTLAVMEIRRVKRTMQFYIGSLILPTANKLQSQQTSCIANPNKAINFDLLRDTIKFDWPRDAICVSGLINSRLVNRNLPIVHYAFTWTRAMDILVFVSIDYCSTLKCFH